MSYLNQRHVYLCGPIKGVQDDGCSWRDEITPILKERWNLIVDDPCKKTIDELSELKEHKAYYRDLIKNKQFKELKEKFYKVVRYDLTLVDKSDFLIVNYMPTVSTIGSTHEMVNASNAKKPILLKYDIADLEHFNPWIFTLIKHNWAFDTWESMFAYLDKINNKDLDTSHWYL